MKNPPTPIFRKTSATFSSCGKYRYALSRDWGDPTCRCAFLMLNPSTADALSDDPTIRRCSDFARRWQFGALDVVNLFAWRSTDPEALLRVEDPVGYANSAAISRVASTASRIVLAWGSHKRIAKLLVPRANLIRDYLLLMGPDVGHLGINADGQPRHPLYLSKTTKFTKRMTASQVRFG